MRVMNKKGLDFLKLILESCSTRLSFFGQNNHFHSCMSLLQTVDSLNYKLFKLGMAGDRKIEMSHGHLRLSRIDHFTFEM